MNLKEEKLDSKIAYKGGFLTLYKDTVKCPNGNISTREYVKHPGASAVLAKLGDKFILERQFRYSINSETLEIPAGKKDYGEDPLECAKRELEEETGYVAKELKFLGVIHTTVGFSDEAIYIYYADNLVKTKTHFDPDEIIELEYYTLLEFKKMIKEGKITDAKTISALAMLEFNN